MNKNSDYFWGETNYRKKRVLGDGSYGSVLLVTDLEGKEYALKHLNLAKYESQKYVLTEKDTLEILKQSPPHPNIVKYKEAIGKDVLVFELCKGGDLLAYSTRSDIKHTENDLKIILSQMVSGLSYLHNLGIAHRDIKPNNVLVHLTHGKKILKLTDFGFAIAISENKLFESNVGSPIFKADEVGQRQYDESIDIYSLGTTIYSLAAPAAAIKEGMRTGRFLLQSNQIQALNKSEEYKDLLNRMVAPSEKRITLKEIANHPFLQSKPVQLNIYSENGLTESTIDVKTASNICLNQISPEGMNINFNNYIIFCSYHGSEDILPVTDNEIYPFYTVESVFLVDLKHGLQVPKISLSLGQEPITSFNFRSKNEECQTHLKFISKFYNFFLLFKAIFNHYISTFDKLNIISALNAILNNSKRYTTEFNILKSLKVIDKNGKDTDKLLIDQLSPFIKSFINSTTVFKYNDMMKKRKEIGENSEIMKFFETLTNLEVNLEISFSDAFAKLKRYLDNFNKGEVINEEESTRMQELISKIMPIHAKLANPIGPFQKSDYLVKNQKMLLESLSEIKILDQINSSLLRDENDICAEISKIPQYYIMTKNELKRRRQWSSQFTSLCSQYAKNIQTVIDKDSAQKDRFDHSQRDSHLLEKPSSQRVENPLKQYLPKNDEDEVDDGFVLVEGKLFSDAEAQAKGKEIDEIQERHIKYLQNNSHIQTALNNLTLLDPQPVINIPVKKIKNVTIEQVEPVPEEKLELIEKLKLENQQLSEQVKQLQEKKSQYDVLESRYFELLREAESIRPQHVELKNKASNIVMPVGGDLYDQSGQLIDLQTRIQKKKFEISEINDKKKETEKIISEYTGNQESISKEFNALMAEYNRLNGIIKFLDHELKDCHDNERVQNIALNKNFATDRDNFQRQLSNKNESLKRIKQTIKELELELSSLNNSEDDKRKFDELQRNLKFKDTEIEQLSAKLSEYEKQANAKHN